MHLITPIQYSLDYVCFIEIFEISLCKSSNFVILKNRFSSSRFFAFLYKYQNPHKKILDQFMENWHLKNIESPDPWTWYISPYFWCLSFLWTTFCSFQYIVLNIFIKFNKIWLKLTHRVKLRHLRWENILDYLGGPNVFTGILIRRKQEYQNLRRCDNESDGWSEGSGDMSQKISYPLLNPSFDFPINISIF